MPIQENMQANAHNDKASFRIDKMEDSYENRQNASKAPRQHDFYTIILTKKARGKHIIDFKSYDLTGNQVYFIRPYQVHQLIEEEKPRGFIISFTNHFLAKNNIAACFIDDLSLFNDFGENPPLMLNAAESEKLAEYASEIWSLAKTEIQFKEEAMGALLKLFLIRCHNLCSLTPEKTAGRGPENSILKLFKNLVREHYSKWHSTGDYAEKLNITPDHLNRVVKSLTGKTAKEHIQDQIILEAKRLIYFTDLTSKEIGYKLGFSEPAHFSAFFKNCTGVSPSKFRESV